MPGLSGQTYDYARLADAGTLPSQAAVVVVAEFRRNGLRIHHVSQTDYLPRKDWAPTLDRIQAETRHVEVLYRLNVAHAVREAEVEDIRRLQQRSRTEAACSRRPGASRKVRAPSSASLIETSPEA
ncbi:MAG: hypothetical protein ACREEG_01065 [Phenylobacterium sp.]